jgi:predicted 2-oxoglutarate/Fe(II)-dependent dioxygenase YbiX
LNIHILLPAAETCSLSRGRGLGEGNKPKACLPVSENVQYLIAESIEALVVLTGTYHNLLRQWAEV